MARSRTWWSRLTKAALFQQFLIQVHARAAKQLGLDVQQGDEPNTIEWVSLGRSKVQEFDLERARSIGLDAVIEEALIEILGQEMNVPAVRFPAA